MSGDWIKRSDAIKELHDIWREFYSHKEGEDMETECFCGGILTASHAIEAIPTIEPKRGRWKIEVAETIYGKAYLLTCSECGETVSVTETALPYEHFCRNCGARMKGKDNE